jgi:hypothetical protein
VTMRFTVALMSAVMFANACWGQAPQRSTYRWTQFVQVDGQPEPVPAEWVSTPEGKFAHSIRIPNPVPKDSGYRAGMSGKEYFDHLCKTEAGEFIYSKAQSIDGLYFMRPPKRPSDDELMDRYKLEAPEIQRLFQLMKDSPSVRARLFMSPPWRKYRFVEELAQDRPGNQTFVRSTLGPEGAKAATVDYASELLSRFGLTWRGIRRGNDRENAISGGEWIVVDLSTSTAIATMRTYGISPRASNTPDQIWWLSASQCPGAKKNQTLGGNRDQLYEFVSRALVRSTEGSR